MAKKGKNSAAFIRLEGVLLPKGIALPSVYIAANSQGFRERFSRLGQIALSLPLAQMLSLADRAFSSRLLYLAFREMSDDRLAILGEEWVEDIIGERINREGLELISLAKKQGHQIVLISESIQEIVEPIGRKVPGIDHVLCNRLVYKNRRATGKLIAPTIGGSGTRRAVLEFAAAQGIDLGNSIAYGSDRSDQLLLASVGKPCAVNPDPLLRWTARQADWPIVDLRP